LAPGGSVGSRYVCNFYSLKNHKIAKNSTTTKDREKIDTHLESFDFWECVTMIKISQNLLIELTADFR
jgi:hypothetical protein